MLQSVTRLVQLNSSKFISIFFSFCSKNFFTTRKFLEKYYDVFIVLALPMGAGFIGYVRLASEASEAFSCFVIFVISKKCPFWRSCIEKYLKSIKPTDVSREWVGKKIKPCGKGHYILSFIHPVKKEDTEEKGIKGTSNYLHYIS